MTWHRAGRIGFIFALGMLAGVLIDKAVDSCEPQIMGIDQHERVWWWDGDSWEYWFDRNDCDSVGDTVAFERRDEQ